MVVLQKQWSKLETASTTYTQWVAALSGKLGAATSDGFVLSEPNIQVFERSFKQEQAKESDTGTQKSSATEPPLGVIELLAASEAKIQTLQVTTADSLAESPEKPDPQAQPSTPKSKPKPKKLGKFNVEIR